MALTENPAGWATGGAQANIKAAMLDIRHLNKATNNYNDVARTSRWETSDSYAFVLAKSEDWRVIVCTDHRQFIAQSRTGTGSSPWRARGFILSFDALPDVLQRRSMGIPAEDLAALLDQLGEVCDD